MQFLRPVINIVGLFFLTLSREVYEERIASYRKIFQAHKEYYHQNPLAQKLLMLQFEKEEIECRIKACDDQITIKQKELNHLTGNKHLMWLQYTVYCYVEVDIYTVNLIYVWPGPAANSSPQDLQDGYFSPIPKNNRNDDSQPPAKHSFFQIYCYSI